MNRQLAAGLRLHTQNNCLRTSEKHQSYGKKQSNLASVSA
jgi:hypothetical protein